MLQPVFRLRHSRALLAQLARFLLLLALPGGTLLAAGQQVRPVEAASAAQASRDLPPVAPADVVAIAEDGKVTLSWAASNEPDLRGYNLYRSTTLPVDTSGTPLNGATPLTINADVDTEVSNGVTYHYAVVAVDRSGNAAMAETVSAVPQETGTPINVRINFQDSKTVPPAGYFRDFGQPFELRTASSQGNGLSYGWVAPGTNTPVNLATVGTTPGNGRNRNTESPGAGEPDLRLATLMHMQGTPQNPVAGAWELQVPNGSYDVTVSVGDAKLNTTDRHQINIEGQNAINNFASTAAQKYMRVTRTVGVIDGRLTIDAGSGINTKINYVDVITAGAGNRPYVTIVTPSNRATGVARNAFVSAEVRLPNVGFGVNQDTLNAATVKLIRVSDNVQIPANANTSGGGDVVVVQPTVLLDPNTQYRFELTEGVKDLSGAAFIPFTSFFTTGTVGGPSDSPIRFAPLPLTTSTGRSYTSVVFGPDGKLYAGTLEGDILRFSLNSDGSLSVPQTISTLPAREGAPRVLVGMAFDPASTVDNLMLWVTHGPAALTNAPDWSGKISRMSGANLQIITDYVINLPRSVKDHLTNSIAFGPDGAMYVPQGSMSAMGTADNAWGGREEHLLSGAILRIDAKKITSPPLDVKTAAGGTYNPFAPGAPVTIYATGVRNAYDLVWHTNGELYAPTNGSAGGGNTPATPATLPASCQNRIDDAANGDYTGPQVTGVTNVAKAQPDYLFRIQPGGYYGHPNPLRCEWVLNGGNPTASPDDPAQIDEYAVNTLPDRNWRGFAFNFTIHYSPNGVIEYQNNVFDGALRGQLLVVRYSGGDDIITLQPGPSKDIIDYETGIAGFTSFNGPIDLVENPATGCLYVAEHDGQRLTLLRPQTPAGATCQPTNAVGSPDIVVSPDRVVTNDVAGGDPGVEQTITIRNIGTGTLTIPSGGITLTGTDASQFQIVNQPGLPTSIAPDASRTVTVRFNPTSAGPKGAILRVQSDDPDEAQVNVTLRGLGTQGVGGSNEPSLQWILDTYQIPVNVGDPDRANNSLPASPLLGEEVSVERFEKSGSGPVTIEPLAVFGPQGPNGVAAKFGFYRPGEAGNSQELFTVANGSHQTLNPASSGGTSFDPGTGSFGFYSAWPFFSNRQVFSEDTLNTWEPTAANRHKVRVYPFKDAGGAVVPNTYIVAMEESTSGYDYQDIVVIVRNVQPAQIIPSEPSRLWVPVVIK